MKIRRRTPETFTLKGSRTGLLLIHGFTGSTAELRPMGEYFHERGYTVHAPLLAGHGTTPEEMALTTWKEWWASATQGYRVLVDVGCEPIFVAGLSMGGILALNLAYHYDVAAVISLCTPIYVQDRRIHVSRWVQHLLPFAKNRAVKEAHIAREIFAYDRTPVNCVASLRELIRHVKKRIPEITVPIFIAQAEKDETVQPKSAKYLYRKIGSTVKELKWYANSGHIITLDRERLKLFSDIERFLRKLRHEQLNDHGSVGN
ncbi:carboxylesterase [Bacillaceae bacterium]